MAAEFDVAQARLQAWHGRRPRPQEWAALEAVLGFEEFLERAQRPPFSRWVEGLRPRPDLHEIDRALRRALRIDAIEMAGWYPSPWREPLARLASAIDLPALAHLERGEAAPGWMHGDPHWRAIALADPAERFRVATGLARRAQSDDLLADWLESWLGTIADRAPFAPLAELLLALRHERGLGARLALLFRRLSGTPAAMACELLGRLLEMQRLRAGLVQRALASRARSVAA